MKQEINWIIHLVANGACDICGKKETGFLPYLCNAHTHGMAQYGHPDFQLVLFLPQEEIGRILNTLGLRVQSGERFQSGDKEDILSLLRMAPADEGGEESA